MKNKQYIQSENWDNAYEKYIDTDIWQCFLHITDGYFNQSFL